MSKINLRRIGFIAFSILLILTIHSCFGEIESDIDSTENQEWGDDSTSDWATRSWHYEKTDEYNWKWGAGTKDGTRWIASCNEYYDFMVGIEVKADKRVYQIKPICARLLSDGTLGDRYYAITWHIPYGNNGASFREECPEGQLIVGFRGRAGGWLNRLGFMCAPVESWRTGGGITYWSAEQAYGWQGSQFSWTFPHGWAADEIYIELAKGKKSGKIQIGHFAARFSRYDVFP